MRGILAAIALALSVAGPAAAKSDAEVRTFRDWLAYCGNDGACVAFGPSREHGPAWVRIEMAAGAEASPVIQFAYDVASGDVPSFTLALDGEDLRTTTNVGQLPAVTGDQARGVLSAMARGSTLIFDGDAGQGEVSLAGVSAALLWVDERQGRLDTPTALIRRGARPAAMVPAPPALPPLRAAPAISQRGLQDRRLPPALAADETVQECLNARPGWPPTAYRLGPDRLLWIVSCDLGAYNFPSDLWTTREDGTRPERVILRGALGYESNGVVNGDYDPETRELSSFAKGRGIGDCGSAQRWLWTGQAFELLEDLSLGDCFGADPSYWPVLWQAKRLD